MIPAGMTWAGAEALPVGKVFFPPTEASTAALGLSPLDFTVTFEKTLTLAGLETS